MRSEQLLLLAGTAASCVHAADSAPRGVGPEFVSFYKPSSGSFQCVSTPSVHIKYDQVNDDYCDCPDGSDEPGTSACAHLSSLSPQDRSSNSSAKLALPGFYCQNKGHNPSYIPFTLVDDGICDYSVCCDGTDEQKIKCENKCKQIGEEWKKLDAARQKSMNAAVDKKRELISLAEKKRMEIQKEIKNLKTQISAAEEKVQKLTKEKAEVEQRERRRASSGGLQADKIKRVVDDVKPKIEEFQDAVTTLRTQREDLVSQIEELEKALDDLRTNYNPNYNDEAVKRVVKTYETYKASPREKIDENSKEEMKMYMLTLSDGISWHEYEEDKSAQDQSNVYANWISDKLLEITDMLAANGIIASTSSSGTSESQAVKNAEKQLDSAKDALEEIKTSIKDHEKDLKRDYGMKDVFRPLKGDCLELDIGEYTYEMCWLDKVHQKSKKGSGSQLMGAFSKYGTLDVDEDLPSDGKGVGSGKRLTHVFENGAHCWNGPDRSTTVVLTCAEKGEIWKVTEEEKCVYRMVVGSPAVCDEPGQPKDSGHKVAGGKPPAIDHDEL